MSKIVAATLTVGRCEGTRESEKYFSLVFTDLVKCKSLLSAGVQRSACFSRNGQNFSLGTRKLNIHRAFVRRIFTLFLFFFFFFSSLLVSQTKTGRKLIGRERESRLTACATCKFNGKLVQPNERRWLDKSPQKLRNKRQTARPENSHESVTDYFALWVSVLAAPG